MSAALRRRGIHSRRTRPKHARRAWPWVRVARLDQTSIAARTHTPPGNPGIARGVLAAARVVLLRTFGFLLPFLLPTIKKLKSSIGQSACSLLVPAPMPAPFSIPYARRLLPLNCLLLLSPYLSPLASRFRCCLLLSLLYCSAVSALAHLPVFSDLTLRVALAARCTLTKTWRRPRRARRRRSSGRSPRRTRPAQARPPRRRPDCPRRTDPRDRS